MLFGAFGYPFEENCIKNEHRAFQNKTILENNFLEKYSSTYEIYLPKTTIFPKTL